MKNIFIILAIIFCGKLNSQNLIPNSDFETFNHCNLDVQIGTLFVGIKKLIQIIVVYITEHNQDIIRVLYKI